MRFENPEITVLNFQILDVITTSTSTPTECWMYSECFDYPCLDVD